MHVTVVLYENLRQRIAYDDVTRGKFLCTFSVTDSMTLTPLGDVYIMGEDKKIFEYLKAYVKREGTAPSIRKFCRDQNMTAPAFYRRYGSVGKLLEKAGLPIDERTKARLLISKKATRKRVLKAERRRSRVQTPAPPVESTNDESAQMPTFEKMEQDREDKKAAHDSIVKNAQRFAEELKTLVLDSNVEVCTAILEALNEILPHVLFYKYDVAADIPDLLSAKDILRQVRKERKKLRKQQNQLDDERQEIQRGRELLKRDSNKASLLEHVEKLEWQMKVNTKRFNEAYEALKRFRVLFRTLWSIASKCPNCPKTFMQKMMNSHGDVLEWLLSKKWTRLSFEAEGTARLRSQT